MSIADAGGRAIDLRSAWKISIGELNGDFKNIRIEPESTRPPGSDLERLPASAVASQETPRWNPAVSSREGRPRTIDWRCQNPGLFRTGAHVL
jgi:hypothetical protein